MQGCQPFGLKTSKYIKASGILILLYKKKEYRERIRLLPFDESCRTMCKSGNKAAKGVNMSTFTIPGSLVAPEAFIEFHFEKYGIELSAGSTIKGNSMEACPASVLLHYDKMWQSVYAEMRRNDPDTKPKLTKFTSESLKNALEMYMLRKPTMFKDKIVTQLKHVDGLEFTQLQNWLIGVTGSCNPIYLGVMKHFMWQVKRKMNGQDVVNHLCPILFGAQGCGKSTAVKRLLAPIADMTMKQQPKESVDLRNSAALNTHFVVFWDEMPQMEKVDLASLKDIVSSELVSFRPLYTNNSKKVLQNCTFIGASNFCVADNIKDNSGGRRFAEIICSDKSDRKLINTIDYVEMWQSIDEALPKGYFESIEAELTELQELATELDEVGHFAEDTKLLPVTGEELRFIAAPALYEAYFNWKPGAYGNKLFYNTFFRKLGNLKLNKKKQNNTRGYFINNKSAVLPQTIHIVPTAQKAEFKGE